MNYATNYDTGERKRTTGINEDSVAISVFEQGHREGVTDDQDQPTNRSGAVFALADGAGGHESGDVASYIATTTICERLATTAIEATGGDPSAFGLDFDVGKDESDTADREAAIEEAIVAAHREILSYAGSAETGSYSTVVAGLSVGGKLHYGWVGDSRAYVINEERGEIARLTKDHAVVEQLREAGEIDDVEAHVHPRGNEITRALGGNGDENPAEATVAVETGTVDLFAEDIVCLTSDGIIDAQTDAPSLHEAYLESGRSTAAAEEIRNRSVTDEDIKEWILSSDSLEKAATTLIDRANDRGGKDNLSTILVSDRALPETPTGGLPIRARAGVDSITDRETVIFHDE